VFGESRGGSDAGAQFLLVVAAGEVRHLPRTLEVDMLSQGVGVGKQSLAEALDDEAKQTAWAS
jgi:hypothetical protein